MRICSDLLSATQALKLRRKELTPAVLYDFLGSLRHCEIQVVGQSAGGRDIFSVKAGRGKQKVLLWSQMHGNEPSSTLALLAVLEFLCHSKHKIAAGILDKLTLLAIPMLNPDGAQRRERRNAMGIDLNRDARLTVAPESKVLKTLASNFMPDWAFNMHDQEIYYGTDFSPWPTSLALLASSPAPGSKGTQRLQETKSVIGNIASQLGMEIHLAKYSDVYMPAAFGDYFASQGIHTILFETGYFVKDSDRQKATFYHALAVFYALKAIAYREYSLVDARFYDNLPFNKKHKFYDIILRGVEVRTQEYTFTADIALSRDRRDREHFTDYDTDYLVYDFGDLTGKHAFYDLDCSGKLFLDFIPGLYQKFNKYMLQCDLSFL